MPTAEIITIGTELLLGEIVDTNAPFIARKLRDVGIDVRRTWSIGDFVDEIANAIREASQRAEIIITTGGLGPTVDDPTREAVARAFDVQTEYHEELWEQVVARFARFDRFPTENNRKQAYVPHGAVAIENPVGTAPAFRVNFPHQSREGQGVVVSLPGVPREMEHLLENAVLPYLREAFSLNSVTVVRVLHTAGVGESQIDEKVADLEALSHPVVGLAAHSGQVDVRISANASTREEALALINVVEAEVRQRLGSWIYGADQETLEDTAINLLKAKNWPITVVEGGLEGKLLRRFASQNHVFLCGEAHPAPFSSLEALREATNAYQQAHGGKVGLGVSLQTGHEKRDIFLVMITPENEKVLRVPYGGPPQLAPRRAVNLGIDLLRKIE
ncbi:MAG: competence/damage-inducible protein A [Anaerolineales bacterium]|nr:competence/damage-inducible protein A [Anaerolineales bacterium]